MDGRDKPGHDGVDHQMEGMRACVIASAAKQSRRLLLDCFVASLLAMTAFKAAFDAEIIDEASS
ncbi:hypothetical protein [Rhodopseudomonas palustris]|uniref:hypothetical protein n=1 Tax=Rhodopseudomonas palustris TaxID=1076 RepID=UPI0011C35743|nr:hypothetical protein [Rhodopseudomonas palustris]